MFLPQNMRIVLVREPVSGRFGMYRLLAQLSNNAFGVGWNGVDRIAVLTFNKKRTIATMIIVDSSGTSLVRRVLNSGRFDIELDEGKIPLSYTRSELEQLLGLDT